MKHVFQFGSVWQRTCHDPNVSLSPLLVRSQLGRQNHITFSPVRRTLRALWLWQQPRRAQEHEANTNEIQRQGVRCPEQQTHAITIYNWGSCPECWGRKNQAQTNKRHAQILSYYTIQITQPAKPIVEKRAGSRDIKSAWPPLQLHIIHPKISPWCLLGQIFQQDTEGGVSQRPSLIPPVQPRWDQI